MQVVPAGEVLVQLDEGEAFLLHVESGRYFGLNRTGVVVWQAIVHDDDPVAALARRWPGVAIDRHRADAEAFVDALRAAGLVRAAVPATPAD